MRPNVLPGALKVLEHGGRRVLIAYDPADNAEAEACAWWLKAIREA